MFADDVRMTIWDTCVQLDDAQYHVQDDVSERKYQMVPSIQLIELSVILSTLVDVETWWSVDTV